MSYIPPHKRQTKGSPSPKPTPAPEFLIPAFRKNVNFKSFGEHKRKEKYLGGILYAHGAVRKWFPVGLTDDSHFSSVVKLVPISVERKSGEKPLSLVLMQGITRVNSHNCKILEELGRKSLIAKRDEIERPCIHIQDIE